MGIALPQLAPASEDRVSGALVIDGSLRFDNDKTQYLTRTPSNAGDRNVWTWSAWVKKTNATEQFAMFSAYGSGSNAGYGMLWFQNDGTLYFHNWDGQNNSAQTNAKFRDTGWYHIVAIHNEAHSTKMRFYVNGTLQTLAYNLTTSTAVNSAVEHRIGHEVYNNRKPYDGSMAQVYLIDGIALGPEYFGYTDPLTDTWRPKKYSFSKKSLNGGVQSWDSYFTTSGSWTDSSNLFDGTLGYGSGGETQVRDGANNNPALDVTIPVSSVGSTPQEVTIAAKMYLDSYAGASPNASTNGFVRVIATIDGTDVTKEYTDATAPNSAGTFNGRYYQDFGSFGTGVVSRVRITTQAAWFHVAGLEVNGTVLQNDINDNTTFHLPFDGNSPIGEDRAPSPNNGTVWSSNLTGTANGSGLITEMFDGNLSSGSWADSNGYVVTFPNGGVTASNNIKLHGGSGSANWYAVINGTKTVINAPGGSSPAWSATGVSGYVDLGSGTLTSIGTEGSGIAQNGEISGVSIDGTLLIDGQIGNSFTPVNFGGSAALDKATGAKPIFSTVDGGTVASAGVFGSEASKTYTVTVASVDGGNRYHFDGVDRPNITLIRGATYTFDQSDSSNGSGGTHPLRFATAADAAGSSQYTDGVATNGTPGQAGAYTKITVPHNAPDTLYYYCTNHGGMGSSTIQITDETKADPYAWKNVLAMPLFDDGDDMSGLVNCTTSTKVITTGGSPAADNNSNFYLSAIDFTASSSTGYYPTGAQSDFTFGTNDFTVEFWFKPTSTSRQYITDFRNDGSGSGSGNNKPFIIFADNGSDGTGTRIRYANDTSSPNFDLLGGVGLPPSNTWHHLAIVRNSGTVYGYLNGVLHNSATDNVNYSTDDSVTIGNSSGVSLNFDGSIQDYRIYNGVAKYTSNFIPASTNPDILPDTPSGVATKSKLKKVTDGAVAFDGTGDEVNVPAHSDLAFGTGNFTIDCFAYFNSFDDTYPTVLSKLVGGDLSWIVRVKNNGKVVWYSKNGSGTNNESSTDPIKLKKWHHIAVVREGTGSNQLKVYVDGTVALTMTDSNDYNDSNALCIGTQQAGGGNTINGFISNVRIVKGTALYTGNFAPPGKKLENVTNTKLLCCQSNSSATAAAVIPTGSITAAGNAAATNFNPFNTDISTVRGQEGVYCTLNPLDSGTTNTTISNGNLKVNFGSQMSCRSTFFVSSGKWYWEMTPGDSQYPNYFSIGIAKGAGDDSGMDIGGGGGPGNTEAYGFYGASSGKKFQNNSISNYGSAYAAGDVIGTALDLDNGTLTFYKNGVSQGTAFTGISGTWSPFIANQASADNINGTVNFGQKPYKFPPPDGFQPLMSSTARPDTVVPRPDKFVKTVLYTGTGAEKILDVGFKPDFSYFSIRNATGYVKYWYDSVRGTTKYLATSETQSSSAEGTDAQTLKSFNSNGVTIGTNGQMNEINKTYVSWHWKAGGNAGAFNKDDVAYASAAAAGLTAGTIAATGSSVGTKQGFSIVSYTAAGGSTASIPHGLEQSPNFVIIKNRDGGASGSAGGWYCVYHDDFPNKSVLAFGDFAPNSTTWNNHGKVTSTTSTVVNVADGDESTPRWWTHNDGSDYIMYSWHNVPGLQKFGTFTGNGNADGTYIELGFRPGIIWLKENENAGNWVLIDGTRSQINPTANTVWMNRNLAENHTDINPDTSYNNMDMLSNGFKMRSSSTGTNRSGGTYIYCAWAEQPSFNLYGGQSNAR